MLPVIAAAARALAPKAARAVATHQLVKAATPPPQNSNLQPQQFSPEVPGARY